MPRKAARRRIPALLGSRSMTKEQYEEVLPPLRDALLAAQQRLQEGKSFSLAVIVTGVPTSGRSEIVNQFLEWLDPKHIRVHAPDEIQTVPGAWPVPPRWVVPSRP